MVVLKLLESCKIDRFHFKNVAESKTEKHDAGLYLQKQQLRTNQLSHFQLALFI